MDRRRAAGALLALAACFACSAAAPTVSNQTSLDLYEAATEGCYYNFQHYGEGDRIMTNEPCLNCTCHNRMLMCYLRVCPFTKPIGQDCTVEKRADQCCPIVTCPDVPVDLLTSTSTTSPAEYGATGIGKLDKFGCSINGKYFPEGSKVPPTPNKPCEHCYCIRNMTTCVMQECTLHVDGCTPIYHKDVCCPVRYSCDHPEDEILGLEDKLTTVRPTPGFLLTTTTVSPVTQMTQDCVHNDQIFADGTSIKTDKACEHCYCMKGDIVCVVQECGTPMENEGKNCTSQPPREGQCCPDTYICEGDEITTDLPELSTHLLIEESTTLVPPRRVGDEGSGYRHDDEPVQTEIPSIITDIEGSGEEPETMSPLDLPEKHEPDIITPLDVTEKPELQSISPLDKTETSESEAPIDELEKSESETMSPLEVTDKHDLETSAPKDIVKEEFETKSPIDLTEKSESDTMSPLGVTETYKPETSTSLDVTEKQELDTETPSDVIEKQESETKLPFDVTEKQVFETISPLDVTEKHETETILPLDVTDKPELDTISPLDVTETHVSDTVSPFDVTEKHELDTTSPLDITEKPASVTMSSLDFTEKDELEVVSSSVTVQQEPERIPSLAVTEQQDAETTIPTEKYEPETVFTLDENKKQTPSDELYTSTEKSNIFDVTKDIEKASEEPDNELNTVSIGESTEPSVLLTTLAEKVSEEQEKTSTYSEDSTRSTLDSLRTTKESILHTTESAFRKEDEPHEPTITSTEKSFEELEPSTSKDVIMDEERGESKPVIDDGAKTTVPALSETTLPEIITELPTSSGISEPVKESNVPTEHVITDFTTLTPTKVETTTTVNAHENEIEDFTTPVGPGRIPGEGDCLQNGITYRNYSSVPSTNNCKTDCRCINSIISCDPIICSPPPEYMSNCVPTYDSVDSCCPTYVCDGSKETLPPQPHSQMSETEPTPPSGCQGDQCDQELGPTSAKPSHIPEQSGCESGDCSGQTSIEPDLQTACGPAGCGELNQKEQHEPSPIRPIDTENCQGVECQQVTPEKTCEGENCQVSPSASCPDGNCKQDDSGVTCEGENCKISPTESCSGDDCKQPLETPCEGENCKISSTESCTDGDCKPGLETPCEGESCKISPTESCSGGKCPQDLEKPCEGESCRISPTESCIGSNCPQDLEKPCEGENCKTSSTESCENEEDCKRVEIPKLDVPCDGDSCKNVPVDCSGTGCEVLPPTQYAPDICVGENCKKPEIDNICTDENCQKKESHTEGTPSKCTDSGCELQIPESPEQMMTPEKSTDMPLSTTEIKLTEENDNISTEISPTKSEAQDVKTSTDVSNVAAEITKAPEYTLDERVPESTVIEMGSDLTTSTQPEAYTEIPVTQATTHQTEKDASSPSPQDQENFTENELEKTHSTKVEDLITSAPEVSVTEQYYTTDKLEEQDIHKKETTAAPIQDITIKSDLESHEDVSKLATNPIPTEPTLTQESGMEAMEPTATEKSDVTNTDFQGTNEHITVTQPVSDIAEKMTTTFKPTYIDTSLPEDNEVINTIPEGEMTTTESSLGVPIDKVQVVTIPPKEKPYTEVPISGESESKKPVEMQTEKQPTEETFTIPDMHISTKEELDQFTTEKETQSTEIFKKPELVTIVPSSESEQSETEMPTDQKFSEPEINTEEPSIIKLDEAQEGSTPQDLFEGEPPGFIPVHPTTVDEKKEIEGLDEIIPTTEVTQKDKLEHITSTTHSIDSITLEQVTETTDISKIETKVPESMTPHDMSPEVHDTEQDGEVTKLPSTEYETKTTNIPDLLSTTLLGDNKIEDKFGTDDQKHTTALPENVVDDHTGRQTQGSSESTIVELQTVSTEPTVHSTEKESPEPNVTDFIELPESHVKDTDDKLPESEISTAKLPDVETTTSILLEVSKIPQSTDEVELGTKVQKPGLEPETSTPKMSYPTTELHEYSETTQDMVELVEHNQAFDTTTLPPIMTVGSEKTSTIYFATDKENELNEKMTEQTLEDHEIETESPLLTQQPVTEGHDHKLDDEVVTETSELEQKPILNEEPTTINSVTPEPDQEVTLIQESEKPEPPSVGQEVTPLEVEIHTEKIETQDKDDNQAHTLEPEFVSVVPESAHTANTDGAGVSDVPTISPNEILDKDLVTAEPQTVPDLITMAEVTQTTVSDNKIITDEKIPITTEPYETVQVITELNTEHADMSPEEFVTKQSVTPITEKEIYTSEMTLPTVEKGTTLYQEIITKAPEIIDTEKKPDQSVSIDVAQPTEMVSQAEFDKEFSTKIPETTEVESTMNPQEESTSETLETSELVKDELSPEVEPSTEKSEMPGIEDEMNLSKLSTTERTDATGQEVTPGKEYSTNQPELELTQRIPEEPEKPTGHEIPPVEDTEKTEIPETEFKDKIDQDSLTKEPDVFVTTPSTGETERPEQEQDASTEKVGTPEEHLNVLEDLVIAKPEVVPIDDKPVQESDSSESEITGNVPETTEQGQIAIETDLSTKTPEMSDNEIQSEIVTSTSRSETPETEQQMTSQAPEGEKHATNEYFEEKEPETSTSKSKPADDDMLLTTLSEISNPELHQTTLLSKDELPAKTTEPSMLTEKTTLIPQTPTSPNINEETERQDEDQTIQTTPSYASKDHETTVVIPETDKSPVIDTDVPIQAEVAPEKPIEVDHTKDTTAPEEEFLTVTTKATTPKIEEETSTQSSLSANYTKPNEISQPELPFSPTDAPPTVEEPAPEEESHFSPSATGGYGGQDNDYEDENQPFGPGTCRYGGKVYVSAQQIPRDDPCDFCFCFRSDIICLQQSCPPPIHGCNEEPIQGFCCPRYECPVSMANTLNITTTTTTTTTTLPPHFPLNAYNGAAQRRGCQIKGHAYKVGEVVRASSGPCLHCTCGGDGQMKCDPKACTPEPMLRQMIAAAVSAKRRR